MSITGKIKTLFSDKEKTEALFPRTKVSAVSDDNGVGLNVLLEQTVPMTRGGTGATNGAEGLNNLFAAGNTVLSPYQYGTELPSNAAVGQLYFEEATGTLADFEPEVVKAMRAVNLLDNSDFRNPVNQRGNTVYNVAGYTIDRWCTQNTELTLRFDSGYLQLINGNASTRYYLQQHIDIKAEVGKVYTMACYDRTAGKIQAFSVSVPEVGSYNDAGNISNGTLRLANDNSHLVWSLMVNANSTARMNWAALYEGEYTAETLPPYVPKGYAHELAECMRYYQRIYRGTYRTAGSTTSGQLFIQLPIGMRKSPSATLIAGGLILTGSSNPAISSISSVSIGNPHYKTGYITVVPDAATGSASWYGGFPWVNGLIELSADL